MNKSMRLFLYCESAREGEGGGYMRIRYSARHLGRVYLRTASIATEEDVGDSWCRLLIMVQNPSSSMLNKSHIMILVRRQITVKLADYSWLPRVLAL